MQRKDITDLINRVAGTGYDDWATDVAFKIYYFPLSSALLDQDEWADVMEDDEINIKPTKVDWVIRTLGARLLEVFKETNNKGAEHLSVIVYGITSNNEHQDVVYHLTHGMDEVNINRLVGYPPLLTDPEAIRMALTDYLPDQVRVIHGMADNRGLDSKNLTVDDYRALIIEEAEFSWECDGVNRPGIDTHPEDVRVAREYRDRLLEIANRIPPPKEGSRYYLPTKVR
jgi:hypothetical protein